MKKTIVMLATLIMSFAFAISVSFDSSLDTLKMNFTLYFSLITSSF